MPSGAACAGRLNGSSASRVDVGSGLMSAQDKATEPPVALGGDAEDRDSASHEGTTAQAAMDACANGVIDGRVVAVISNNRECQDHFETGQVPLPTRAYWPASFARHGVTQWTFS